MSFLIYFDEANKIDQPGKDFSYYGAYCGIDTTIAAITKEINTILKSLKSKSELHFREYNHDGSIKKYFQVLNHVINQNIRINILIVDNQDALKAASNIGISIPELRNLFYIKIPERLFYGMTRDLEEKISVKIKVDRNDEYGAIRLYSKIKEQMNAHATYRNKHYKIDNVQSQESHKSIPLQIIDTFIGITMFLMEKTFLKNHSNGAIIKSDLIYRFLIQGDNTIKFQNQIRLFQWTGKEQLSEIPISNYLSEFFVYKTQYDITEMTKLQSFTLANTELTTKELRLKMEYPNTMKNTLLGYKDELTGIGRNTFLLK